MGVVTTPRSPVRPATGDYEAWGREWRRRWDENQGLERRGDIGIAEARAERGRLLRELVIYLAWDRMNPGEVETECGRACRECARHAFLPGESKGGGS